MATEVTVIMRFAGYPPPDLEQDLEDDFDCVVVEYEEREV